ncbi:MAG TPA: ABC transporter permease [Gemmatimonadaceae bacterium]|nr:ABC transporter permease [Gemmatimonadaceae bacterium]
MQDIRFAMRSLARTPSFTIAAVLALGLGIGSTAGVFSLLEGIVLRPLPYANAGRLVMIWEGNDEKKLTHQPISPVNFVDYRQVRSSIEDAAAWWRPQLNLADDATGDPIRVPAIETSQNLFRVLGVAPAIGRGFSSDSTLTGRTQEAIISHRLWQSRFGGDRAVLGRAVRLNGYLYTIVGVMPPGFGFPGETDLWEGLNWDLSQHSRGAHFMEAVARLRPGVTPEQANRELAALGTRLGTEFPSTNGAWRASALVLDREVAGVFRPALFALLGASALLLLIACLNVANLLLARSTSRRREVAVRAALGASRGRLVRLFLTENVVLAAAGAILGLVVATASVKGLLAWSPIQIPRAGDVHVDGAVLLFATLIAVFTSILFGLVPSLLMSRAELQDALREGTRGAGSRTRVVRGALVVGEVALAVMLLCGAGLLVRSVERLIGEDVGVDVTSVLTANIQLPDAAYRDWNRVDLFFSQLLPALRAHREVAAAGVATFLPLDAGWRLPFGVPGTGPALAGQEPEAQHHSVDDGYFAALKVPLVRGRGFDTRDDAKAPGVVVINETMARQIWPGEDAVGKRITTNATVIGPLGRRIVPGNEFAVVGVVRDIKNASLRSGTEPAVYFTVRQFPFRKLSIVVRGRGSVNASQLDDLLRTEVHKLDPTLPLADVKPMARVLAASVDPPRFIMLVMSLFAALAVTLAAVGIYGILTYAVTNRRREIGIRLALGAQSATMLRMVLREGLSLALLGCVIGVAGALASGRAIAGLLYGVTPWDPPTVVAVTMIVLVVAFAACLVPGWRAAAEDPAEVLRGE